jgi:hypothetical protein
VHERCTDRDRRVQRVRDEAHLPAKRLLRRLLVQPHDDEVHGQAGRLLKAQPHDDEVHGQAGRLLKAHPRAVNPGA